MTEKNLFEGADDYTTPAEIADSAESENPEVTPTVVVSIAASASAVSGASVSGTKYWGC
ncbi:hypothetical protein SUDANB121_03531 [Nocardiopsis dassonvillei]|uniref:LxmA leader domain family RiPP n=1 Tax=Nocardiopsis dassonvillei TaxID=2014 RepID=UPI003F55189F